MRLLHLSDLHYRHHLAGASSIPARDSRGVYERLGTVVGGASCHQVDLVVVGGDILDYPLDALDDPTTQQAGLADLALIRDLLDRLPCPYLIIPGNHDHPALFSKIFDDLALECCIAGHRLVAFDDYENITHEPLRPTKAKERFLRILGDGDPLPQIHIQHFVVWPELNEHYPHTYTDSEWMCDSMAQSGKVRLCLSGHYHAGTDLISHKGVWFSTVPALCEAPYPYRIYEIDSDGVTMSEYPA